MADDGSGADGGGERGLADEVADYLLYAPLGLILSIGEDLPKLVEKGRSRVESRVNVARAVGQFAVAMGRKKAEDVVRQRFAPPSRKPSASSEPPAGASSASEAAEAAEAADTAHVAPPAPERTRTPRSTQSTESADVTADSLAIPGYDSLAASQVVQRLEGLSAEELDEVRRYEEATRGRRTILSRINQLTAAPQS